MKANKSTETNKMIERDVYETTVEQQQQPKNRVRSLIVYCVFLLVAAIYMTFFPYAIKDLHPIVSKISPICIADAYPIEECEDIKYSTMDVTFCAKKNVTIMRGGKSITLNYDEYVLLFRHIQQIFETYKTNFLSNGYPYTLVKSCNYQNCFEIAFKDAEPFTCIFTSLFLVDCNSLLDLTKITIKM
jgi:hypothetical protein